MSESRKLAERISDAVNAVEEIPRAGRNDQQRFHYAKGEDIIAAGSKALNDNGVIVLPSVLEVGTRDGQTKQGAHAVLATVRMQYKLVDVAGPEEIALDWSGAGYDTPGDKAISKAQTSALKFFLINLLQIRVVDEIETVQPDVGPALATAQQKEDVFGSAEEPGLLRSARYSQAEVDAIAEWACVNRRMTRQAADQIIECLRDGEQGGRKRLLELAGVKPTAKPETANA